MRVVSSQLKPIPQPKEADPWLSPREASERLLEVNAFPRSPSVVRNLTKSIQGACRANAEFRAWVLANRDADPGDYDRDIGIDCDQLLNGQYRFRLSELARWSHRNSRRGLCYSAALDGRRGQY